MLKEVPLPLRYLDGDRPISPYFALLLLAGDQDPKHIP
jgi:hypothetical protein